MAFSYPHISDDISLKIFVNNQLLWTIENGKLIEGDGLWGKQKYDFSNDFKIKNMIDGYEDLNVTKEGKLMEQNGHRLIFRFPYNKGDITVRKRTRQGFFGNDYANFALIDIKGRQPNLETDGDLFKVIGRLLLTELEKQNFVGKAANDNDSQNSQTAA